MKKFDTLFYFERGMPLQPMIEEVLEDGSVRVSILPGLIICPNLKQKFVPILKKEFFSCKEGDCFYFVIDGNLGSLPVSINDISIEKMPEKTETDPNYVLFARLKTYEGENETKEFEDFSIENLGGFYKYNQLYLSIEASEIEEDVSTITYLL